MDMITFWNWGLFVIAWTTCLAGEHSTRCEECPGGVATLMADYEITGKSSSDGFVWVRPNDIKWVVTCNPNCSFITGYSATRNSTHSTLTIASVQPGDEGLWLLNDASNESATGVPVCQLSAREATTNSHRINITTATTLTPAHIPEYLIMNLVLVWLVIPMLLIVIVAMYRFRN